MRMKPARTVIQEPAAVTGVLLAILDYVLVTTAGRW
jgi:hypothetical protein